MANIKSIGGNPIVLDASGIAAGAVTPDKLAASASFDGITAGAALGITGEATDSAAWLQRVSTSDGPTTIRSIHGRTLAWNQLCNLSVTQNTTGLTVVDNGDGSVTVSGTSSVSEEYAHISMAVIPRTSGHKYLIKGCPAGGSASTYYMGVNTSQTDFGSGGIYTSGSTGNAILRLEVCASGITFDNVVMYPQVFDLTVMFGAGSEPSTVAEFEALYPLPYYPYDAGSLLPVNMTGIETEDANGDPLAERSIDAANYFPDGMRSAGTVYDELTETQAITRIGERAYQSGDESDATVVTDGTVTHYALATPTTVEIDPPLNMTYRTAAGGTERVMVPTGELSAPPTLVTAQGYTAESMRDAALSAIAPVENGIASTNYAVGAYLIHGGQLCKVTTAIATGESITIGTNVTATTVMAEVIALAQ